MTLFRSLLLACTFLATVQTVQAATSTTHRTPLLNNHQVSVWKTTIYPSKQQQLAMHNHQRDRVVIALTDGKLIVNNDQGGSHTLVLQKNHAYYLAKDKAGENHVDFNPGSKPIEVFVIELS